MIINTKTKMYKALQKGLFGNTGKYYKNINFIPKNEIVTLRYKDRNKLSGKNFLAYDITKNMIKPTINKWVNQGAKEENIFINQSQNDNNIIVQGELTINEYGYYFYHSFLKEKIRIALKKDGKVIHGLQVSLLLKRIMDINSYNDTIELLETYPNHIIELSIYNHYTGTIPNRNTIIWEVRAY